MRSRSRADEIFGKALRSAWASQLAHISALSFIDWSFQTCMGEVEMKRIPKFKRCKITQQQLNALMANFGARLTIELVIK